MILASTIRPQPFSNQTPEHRSNSITSSIRRTLRGNRFANKIDESPVLLEFDLDSSFTFVRTFVERNGTLKSRNIPELVVQRINYCNQEADLWKRQIKIAHDIIPRSGSDSGCSSGDSPTHTTQKPKRPTIFDEDFKKGFGAKNASIGSRASSNASNASRISKVLRRFWNPLRKRRGDDGFSEIEEDATESDDEDELHDTLPKKKLPDDPDEYHFYETLKKSDEAKFYPPKQKLTRKQTLDVIFPADIKVDDNGYILSATNHGNTTEDDPVYSTLG